MKTLKTKTASGKDVILTYENGVIIALINGFEIELYYKGNKDGYDGYHGQIKDGGTAFVAIDTKVVADFRAANSDEIICNNREEAVVKIKELRIEMKNAKTDGILREVAANIQALINQFGYKCSKCGKIEWTLQYGECADCNLNDA